MARRSGLHDIVNSETGVAVMGLRRGDPGQAKDQTSLMEEIFGRRQAKEQRAMPHPGGVHGRRGPGPLGGFAMISDKSPAGGRRRPFVSGPDFPVGKLPHRPTVQGPWLRRGTIGARVRGIPSRTRPAPTLAVHQAARTGPGLNRAGFLPQLRLHRHGPGHGGDEETSWRSTLTV